MIAEEEECPSRIGVTIRTSGGSAERCMLESKKNGK
jgi:hypothetical protein